MVHEKHKRYSKAFKIKIARMFINKELGATAIARKYGIADSLVYLWKKKFADTAIPAARTESPVMPKTNLEDTIVAKDRTPNAYSNSYIYTLRMAIPQVEKELETLKQALAIFEKGG